MLQYHRSFCLSPSAKGTVVVLLSCSSTTVSHHCSDPLLLPVLCFLLHCSPSSTACCVFCTPADRGFSSLLFSLPCILTLLACTLSTLRSLDTHPPKSSHTQLSSERLAFPLPPSVPCTSCASAAPNLPQQYSRPSASQTSSPPSK